MIDPQIYSQTFSFPNSKLKLTVQDCNLSPTIQLTKPKKKFILTEPEIYDLVNAFHLIVECIETCKEKIKKHTGEIVFVTLQNKLICQKIPDSNKSRFSEKNKFPQSRKKPERKMNEQIKCNGCSQMKESWQGNPFCEDCFDNCKKVCPSCQTPFACVEKNFTTLASLRCKKCEKKKKREEKLSDPEQTDGEEIDLKTENSKKTLSRKKTPKKMKEAMEEKAKEIKKKRQPQKKMKADDIKQMIDDEVTFQLILNYP